MAVQQTYQNHTRWFPLVHFVIMPLTLVNLGWHVYMLTQERTVDRGVMVMMGIVFGLLVLAARLQALRAQDRVIRLEEDLRFMRLLSPEVAKEAVALRTGTKIALRFAPDDELPALVQRVLNGELKSNKEIKQAIKNWRGDYLRV